VRVELVLLVNEDVGEVGEEVGNITKLVQSLPISCCSTEITRQHGPTVKYCDELAT
jgi:hypothetical protein